MGRWREARLRRRCPAVLTYDHPGAGLMVRPTNPLEDT